VTSIDAALPAMQALASRTWTPGSRQHPGQLAWSARYAPPEELGHGPVELFRDAGGTLVGWAWAEAADWIELCVDPEHPDVVERAVAWFLLLAEHATVRTTVLETEAHLLTGLRRAGFAVEDDQPWFTHHHLELGLLPPIPHVEGYTFRSVGLDEAEDRAACHRAAWTPPGGTSRVTGAAYRRVMRTPPYRPELDWVALDAHDHMVASCLVWRDDVTGVALVEPVGCVPEHRGRGLAGAVSIAALHAARAAGSSLGLVCPRGDAAYPVPQRVYRAIGFRPGPRTLTLVRPTGARVR
jgi:predicted N-acetyltransferase YhbS